MKIDTFQRTVSALFAAMIISLNSACTPLSAVGAIGSTITNAAYNEAERRNKSSYVSPQQKLEDISEANLRLGIAYMQNGQYQKSLEKLERARLARRDNAQVYNALGLLYKLLGQGEVAENNFRRALELDQDNSSIMNNYALFLCQVKRYDEAETVFRRAAENPLYQTPEIALTNAGTCALENSEQEKAEGYFTLALKHNTNVPPALIQMTEISYSKRDYYSARNYLQRYLTLKEHTAKSLYLGIQIEQELGDRDRASSYTLLLKNRFPDSREAAIVSGRNI